MVRALVRDRVGRAAAGGLLSLVLGFVCSLVFGSDVGASAARVSSWADAASWLISVAIDGGLIVFALSVLLLLAPRRSEPLSRRW